jgi:hypothetical protein
MAVMEMNAKDVVFASLSIIFVSGVLKISIEPCHYSRLRGRKSNLPNRRRECMQLGMHIGTTLKMAAHSSEVKDAPNDIRVLRSGVLK